MSHQCNALLHNSRYAYQKYGCRCPAAIAARRAEHAATRGRRPKARQVQPPVHHDLDEVAVLRALRGEPVPIGTVERQLAIAYLTRHGHSINQIAGLLGISHATVSRHRQRLKALL